MASLFDFKKKTTSFMASFVTDKGVTRKKRVTLRPYTLADTAYIQSLYTQDELVKNLETLNAECICKLVWHQMTNDSKKLFLSAKVIELDENTGEEYEIEMEGWKRLFNVFTQMQDLIPMYNAWLECRGINSKEANKRAAKSLKKKIA